MVALCWSTILLISYCLCAAYLGLNTVEVEMHKTASSFGDDSRGLHSSIFSGVSGCCSTSPNHTSTYTYTHGNATQWKKVECYFSETLKWTHGPICPKQYVSMHLCVVIPVLPLLVWCVSSGGWSSYVCVIGVIENKLIVFMVHLYPARCRCEGYTGSVCSSLYNNSANVTLRMSEMNLATTLESFTRTVEATGHASADRYSVCLCVCVWVKSEHRQYHRASCHCPSYCKIFTIESTFSPSAQIQTLLRFQYESKRVVGFSSQALSLGWRVYEWTRPKLAPTMQNVVEDEQSTHLFTITFLQRYACIWILSRLAPITLYLHKYSHWYTHVKWLSTSALIFN